MGLGPLRDLLLGLDRLQGKPAITAMVEYVENCPEMSVVYFLFQLVVPCRTSELISSHQ